MKKHIIAICLALFPFYAVAESSMALQNYYKGEYMLAAPGLAEAAQAKNPQAAFYLGKMYLHGLGVQKDTAKANDLIQQSAKLNFLPAQMYLAKYYLLDKANFSEAFSWFQKAAEQGNTNALMFCATAYLNGFGVKKNSEKAKQYIIKAAQKGDAVGQYELAKIFLNARYMKDEKMGLIWLKKSAQKKNPNAEYLLGSMMLEGNKVPKNTEQAIELLQDAAAQKNYRAALLLGNYYLSLPGSLQNFNTALYWYAQSIGVDDNETKYQLALLYFAAPSEFKNPDHPEWLNIVGPFSKLSEYSKSLAPYYRSGEIYSFIQPVLVDWIEGLAKAGDVNAQREVGFMYDVGTVVPANKNLAQQWLKKAALNNDYLAKFKLNQIKTQWNNKQKLAETEQKTPKIQSIEKSQIFNSDFQLAKPIRIPIQSFIYTLGELDYQKEMPTVNSSDIKVPIDENTISKEQYEEIIRLANLGNAQAQCQLGNMYEEGLGVPADLKTAEEWYKKSAIQNYSNAEYQLGLLALEGKDGKKNYATAQSLLIQAALKGNTKAQFLLAQLYERSYGKQDTPNYIAKNLTAAQVMYGLAASSGMAMAQYDLAKLYISGQLEKPSTVAEQQANYRTAFELFKQAAEGGIPQAKLALAYFYADQNQTLKNQKWAFNFANAYIEKYNMNNPATQNITHDSVVFQNVEKAKLLLALMYDRGIGIEPNKRKAIGLYQELAEAGNPIASFILGSYYGLGEWVSKSDVKAERFLKKAGDEGLPYANYNLAILNFQNNNIHAFLTEIKQAEKKQYQPANILLADYYLTHETSDDRLKEAVNTYQGLAAAGNIDAEIKLAYMYQQGIYFTKNDKLALEWFEKAANSNNALAQYAVGEMYQLGQGADRDLKTAMNWYQKAAEQNYAPAQVALGFINEVDIKNYKKALYWYKLAVKNQNRLGDYNLALMYEYGKGINVDMSKAKELFQSAEKKREPINKNLKVADSSSHID